MISQVSWLKQGFSCWMVYLCLQHMLISMNIQPVSIQVPATRSPLSLKGVCLDFTVKMPLHLLKDYHHEVVLSTQKHKKQHRDMQRMLEGQGLKFPKCNGWLLINAKELNVFQVLFSNLGVVKCQINKNPPLNSRHVNYLQNLSTVLLTKMHFLCLHLLPPF